MTKEEIIAQIQPDFNTVLEWSQSINGAKTDKTLDVWYEAKKYFINKFGGLIWQSPEKVSFHLTSEDMEKKISNFIDNIVLYRYDNYALAHFLRMEKEGFFENIVANEYKTNDGTIIPKGMKLVKAFKFFEEDPARLDKLQTEASVIIQENKIEGYFCLSVHPLDFLSASENQYNWRSCHALDGEYRAGNLSFLMDSATVMCYIKGDNDTILPNFPSSVPWNNKKWRMWLYVAEEHNALMAGRQYPFTIGGILDYARKCLFELTNYHDYNWSKWHHDLINNYTFKDGTDETVYMSDLIVIGGEFRKRKNVISDAPGSLHYDDLLYSSYYTPWYCWRTTTKEQIHFTLGHEVYCIQCGNHTVDDNESMLCGSCNWNKGDYYTCDECGRIIHSDDDVFWVGDRALCEHCFDEYCVTCEDCGQAMYREDAYYDENTGDYYCYHCWHRHHHTNDF